MLLTRQKLTMVLVFVALCSKISIGNNNFPVGARQAGMGNAALILTDVWSLSHNQAGLGYLTRPVLGMYAENRFIVKELGFYGLGVALPINTGTVGASINYFGYKYYYESKIGLAYGREFGEKISVGLQLDYFNQHIAESPGNNHAVTFEAGFLAKPVSQLIFGAHVFNPVRAKTRGGKETTLPVIFRVGMGYYFSQNFLFSTEGEKQLGEDVILKAGLEYKVVKQLFLRAGIFTNPLQNTFGLGYKMNNLVMDIAFSCHPLGLTPHFSIIYQFS